MWGVPRYEPAGANPTYVARTRKAVHMIYVSLRVASIRVKSIIYKAQRRVATLFCSLLLTPCDVTPRVKSVTHHGVVYLSWWVLTGHTSESRQ